MIPVPQAADFSGAASETFAGDGEGMSEIRTAVAR